MFLQQLKRLTGAALIAGGLLWIAAGTASIIIGMLTGKVTPGLDASSPLIARIGIWLLPLGILPLGVGLLGIFSRLAGRSKGLSIPGVALAAVGILLGVGALINLSGIFGTSDRLNALLGVFGSFAIIIGTGFLCYERRRLRRANRVALLAELIGKAVHMENPLLASIRNAIVKLTPSPVLMQLLMPILDYNL